MSRLAIAMFMVLALAGCVVVWGRAYEIEDETSESITIKYDSNFTSLVDVQNVAQASCSGHAKAAVQREISTSILHLTTVVYGCVATPLQKNGERDERSPA